MPQIPQKLPYYAVVPPAHNYKFHSASQLLFRRSLCVELGIRSAFIYDMGLQKGEAMTARYHIVMLPIIMPPEAGYAFHDGFEFRFEYQHPDKNLFRAAIAQLVVAM